MSDDQLTVGEQQERARLLCGGWFWPAARQARRQRQHAYGIVEPVVRPGEVLVVSGLEQEDRGALFFVRVPPSPGERLETPMDTDAKAAWRDAVAAVPHGVPVLWGDLTALRDPDVLYARRATHWEIGRATPWLEGIAGSSCGLAFALAIVSSIYRIPLPTDFVATATIDGAGRVGRSTPDGPERVGHLRAKLATILSCAPGVRRLFVAQHQVDEAQAALGRARKDATGPFASRDLDIVGVKSLAQALELLLPDLEEALVEAGTNDQRRSDITRQLFTLSLRGRRHLGTWAPVRRTAELALARWADPPPLLPQLQFELGVIQSIAARFDAHRIPLPDPQPEYFDRHSQLEPEDRRSLMANYVQSAADCVQDLPAWLWKDVDEWLDPAIEHLEVRELEVLGARARYRLSSGDDASSLSDLSRAAHSWIERAKGGKPEHFIDASHSVTLGLWLACAIQNKDALEGFEQALKVVCTKTKMTEHEPDLYYSLSLVRLAALRNDLDRTRALAEHIERTFASDSHAVASARRWLARACDSAGRFAEATDLRDRIASLPKDLRFGADLVALESGLALADAAARAGALNDVSVHLDTAEAAWPPIVRRFRDAYARTGAGGERDETLVLDRFPY